jgi:hypothetical protein
MLVAFFGALLVICFGLPIAAEPERNGPPPEVGSAFEDYDEAGHGEHKHRGPLGRLMTAEQLEDALEVVAAYEPDAAARLKNLIEENPEDAQRLIQRHFPAVRFLVQLKERDPEMYEMRMRDLKLNRESWRAAKALREAKAKDELSWERKRELEEQVESLVKEHFEVRQAIRERELQKLRDRIEELEEQLDKRSDDRRDLIEQRVEQLIESGDEPRW